MFDFKETIKTTFWFSWKHARELVGFCIRPALMCLLIGAVLFGVAFFIPGISIGDQSRSSPIGTFVLLLLGYCAFLLPFAMIAMNWQSFVLLDDGKTDTPDKLSRTIPKYMDDYAWHPRFRLYLTRSIQFGAVYILFLAIASALSALPALIGSSGVFLSAVVSLGLAILLVPFVGRAVLVFPAVAADNTDTSFKTPLGLTTSMGWKIMLTVWTAMLLVQIAMMILFSIIGLVTSFLGGLGSIIQIALMLTAFFAWIAILSSVPAFILMQMRPEYEERWKFVSARQ